MRNKRMRATWKFSFFAIVAASVSFGVFLPKARANVDLVNESSTLQLQLLDGFDVITKGSPSYDNATALGYGLPVWQQQQPASVVTANSPHDVQTVIQWAASNLREGSASSGTISPVGGAHSGAGYAFSGKIAAVVIGEGMSQVGPLNTDDLTLEIGAGAKLGDVINYLNGSGYITATGECGGVGFAGWTLGGGFSYFSKFLGLGVDNVVSFDVVLANGTIAQANETSLPSLFWALRGAGHQSFAYVTKLKVRLMPLKTFVSYKVTFPCETDIDFCAKTLHNLQTQLLGNTTWIDSKMTTSEVQFLRNETRVLDDPMLVTLPFIYASDSEDAVEEMKVLLEPFNQLLANSPTAVRNHIVYTDYNVVGFDSLLATDDTVWRTIVNPFYETKIGLYLKRDMTEEDWMQLINACLSGKDIFGNPQGGFYFALEPYSGRVAERLPDETAHFQRGQVLGDMFFDIFTPTFSDLNKTPEEWYEMAWNWLESLYKPSTDGPAKLEGLLYKHNGRFQSYVNYKQLRYGEGEDRWPALETYYGGNLCKLVDIKREFDPNLVFDFPQGIPLEAPPGKCDGKTDDEIELSTDTSFDKASTSAGSKQDFVSNGILFLFIIFWAAIS